MIQSTKELHFELLLTKCSLCCMAWWNLCGIQACAPSLNNAEVGQKCNTYTFKLVCGPEGGANWCFQRSLRLQFLYSEFRQNVKILCPGPPLKKLNLSFKNVTIPFFCFSKYISDLEMIKLYTSIRFLYPRSLTFCISTKQDKADDVWQDVILVFPLYNFGIFE